MVPALVLASSINMHAQIKNAQTITAKVSGNCGMCETTIEKAGNIKKEAEVEWDKDKQVATITHDPLKTNPDQVLRRIALAGYDNEKYLAPEETYNNLHGCCQYERTIVANDRTTLASHSGHTADNADNTTTKAAPSNVLTPVFNGYFRLQEALVKSDAKQAASIAGELRKTIANVSMASLTGKAHNTWMAASDKLISDAKGIAESQDLKKQRALFASLSDTMHTLANVAGLQHAVYYNNCPMFNDGKGANWLSDKKGIRNPYYGTQMLTCGKTIETIQK